ncbi:hypothetical protein B1987_08110 [Mycobacterium kansasii]|uniref:Putative PPE family protein PPE29 n=1 Tax=Mycobacterium attenuatum TaxID=2341086 RepID=A0A498Q2G9_9MYCO|nr:PPE family protein [Mycobacterium attenuatum]ORB83777.1 hypothetical protein B1987_08110 [Mycobacterium kansasii]VBA39104.1 putative PPE family protein PPE29 [Mycobacterium attenuatum]VBA53342.1 putative PPE family protein PPE29 [Mycobacterium attenuatum]VBA58201.1 putative PPE family protein PPE29 [Mycobacterium attenuatum]
MDFGALPPEVNSLRMYCGPGSAPLLAAVAAWDGLAAELRSTANSYDAVISELAGEGWLGPASASMAAAVAPYMAWMSSTGVQAEQTAAQAAAAAGAFEAAYAMTVPPAMVAANRARLMMLIATNIFGQNTPAIAATEAEYGEMWAQDAAAMYGYAAGAAAASTLTPFTEPAQTTNPAGQAGQASAVAQAAGSAAGTLTQSELPQLMSAVPSALQGLASPASALSEAAAANPAAALPVPGGILADILNFLDGNDGNPYGIFFNSSLVNGFTSAGYVSPDLILPVITGAMADLNSLQAGGLPIISPPDSGHFNFPALAAASAPASAPASTGVSSVVTGLNRAAFVGRLSVPESWTAATQVVNHAGAAAPGGGWTSSAIVPDAAAGTPGVPGMPAPGVYGHSFGSGPRYGFRPTIMSRPPAAG